MELEWSATSCSVAIAIAIVDKRTGRRKRKNWAFGRRIFEVVEVVIATL